MWQKRPSGAVESLLLGATCAGMAALHWCKLETLASGDNVRWFLEAYRAGGPAEELWDERVLVVDLIESLNVVANAVIMGWSAAFEATARTWLAESLEQAAASSLRP